MVRQPWGSLPVDELTQLIRLCRGLGADGPQAELMARQLSKRADQLVAERGQTREAAMEYLLRIVVQGHAGEVPAEFSAEANQPDQNKVENSKK